MKYASGIIPHAGTGVAPLAGAWIEIDALISIATCHCVAPLAGGVD